MKNIILAGFALIVTVLSSTMGTQADVIDTQAGASVAQHSSKLIFDGTASSSVIGLNENSLFDGIASSSVNLIDGITGTSIFGDHDDDEWDDDEYEDHDDEDDDHDEYEDHDDEDEEEDD